MMKRTRMKLLVLLGGLCGFGLASLCAATFAASIAAAPSERELHSAMCVAALDVNTVDLAAQVKAGNPGLRPRLMARLEAGAAFVGTAYLQGDRDEARSLALLKAATDEQKALTDAELSARQLACAAEGAHLLAETNFILRAGASHLAERRMKKLLAP